MKHSEMLNLNLPEDSDLINVSQISDNFERLDSVVDIIPVKQETTTTDIDTTVYPPYWSMTNNTDSNITYIDHKFFDEEFVIEPGQTIRTDIDTPTEISISSETTLDYVYYIPAKDAFSGGGSGGTSDYNKLSNQPKVNGVTLSGNKSAADLGLASASDLSGKISSDEKGASNGIATLDADGKVPQSQLPTPVAQKEYKLTETTSESYAKSYKLQVKNGETWSDVSESATINIPKDMVVESGSVKECTTDNVPVSGYKKGDKYIDLVIANKTDAHIYINVKDLIDNKAEGIQYSNTTSKLTATNVQSAIDEIAALAKSNEDDISDINEALEKKVNQTELLSTISASSTTQIRDSKTVEFDGTGKNLEKLVIEGKTVQDGTPSPSAPVEIEGVGDKSRNLIDQNTVYSNYVQNDGTIRGTNAQLLAVHISLPDEYVGKKITASIKVKPESGVSRSLIQYRGTTNADGNSVNVNVTDWTTITVTYTQGGYFQLNYGSGTGNVTIYEVMIEEGSSRTAYEPYGKYKIPISSGGKSSNIYLDQPLFNKETLDTEKTVVNRSYKKMVFDGTNTGASVTTSSSHSVYRIYVTGMKLHGGADGFCDRFVSAVTTGTEGAVTFSKSSDTTATLAFTFPDSLGLYTIEAMNAWFAANPTTVYYPLATETKEPFDAPEIATTVGKNTLTVGTDVTPAKVEVTSFGEYYSKAQIDKMFADVQADLAAMAELL